MYENETIVAKYKVLDVNVLIKEHQFPDDNEIGYFAYFRLNGQYHVVNSDNLVGLKNKVFMMINSNKYK